jgi:hypothetical protein
MQRRDFLTQWSGGVLDGMMLPGVVAAEKPAGKRIKVGQMFGAPRTSADG